MSILKFMTYFVYRSVNYECKFIEEEIQNVIYLLLKMSK